MCLPFHPSFPLSAQRLGRRLHPMQHLFSRGDTDSRLWISVNPLTCSQAREHTLDSIPQILRWTVPEEEVNAIGMYRASRSLMHL